MSPKICSNLGFDLDKIRTAAVCVYPSRVEDAYKVIKKLGLIGEVQIAAGMYFLYLL